MLIDTHCHLNFKAFNEDLDDVVRRAKEAEVGRIIVPGTDLVTSQKAIEIANLYPDICYAAVGIHPHHIQDPNLVVNNSLREQLEELIIGKGPSYAPNSAKATSGKKATEGKIVAIGEIGLDYYRYTKTKYENNAITDEIKQKQKELLLMQLELALIHNLPVILHCREAHVDLIQVIRRLADNAAVNRRSSRSAGWRTPDRGKSGSWQTNSRTSLASSNRIKPSQPTGVFHCFTGSTSQLQLILTMGFYVGFDGNITYNKSQYSPLVAAVPLDRILLETDSPYLTPIPHRGTRNEPAYLTLVAETIAKYHSSPLSADSAFVANLALPKLTAKRRSAKEATSAKVDLSQVIHLSTNNARSLFDID